MTYLYAGLCYDSNYLSHHGVKGQKWGVQNNTANVSSNARTKVDPWETPEEKKKRLAKAKKKGKKAVKKIVQYKFYDRASKILKLRVGSKDYYRTNYGAAWIRKILK